jgi:hypothetical protein
MAKLRAIDPLADAKTAPLAVTKLVLNPAAARNAKLGAYEALSEFPREILACTNLVELEIFRGIDYRTARIPDELGELRHLKRLSLGGMGFSTLPDSIGELGELESLALAYADQLQALPASIGRCRRLGSISLAYAGVTALPESIGELAALRELNASNTKLATVPASLWRATELQSLILPDTIGALPRGIAALAKLEQLELSPAALASIAGELAELRALQELRVRGKADALSSLATVCARSISIAYLGLRELPMLPESVEALDVSGNQLSSVIALTALAKLRELDFGGNRVPIDEARTINNVMKLPPGKRNSAPTISAKSNPVKLARLGDVCAINAALDMIVGAPNVIAKWRGTGDSAKTATGNARST